MEIGNISHKSEATVRKQIHRYLKSVQMTFINSLIKVVNEGKKNNR